MCHLTPANPCSESETDGCKTGSDTPEESSTSGTHSTLSTGSHNTHSAGTHSRYFELTRDHPDGHGKSYTSRTHSSSSQTGTHHQPLTHADGTPDTRGGAEQQPAAKEVVSAVRAHQQWRGDGMWTVEYPPNTFRSHRIITPWQRKGQSQNTQGQDNSAGLGEATHPDQKDRYQELLDAWSVLNTRWPSLPHRSDEPRVPKLGSTNNGHRPTSSAPVHRNYHHQQKQQKWQQQPHNQDNPSWTGNWPRAHLSVSQPQLAWPSLHDIMRMRSMAVDRDGSHQQGATEYHAKLSSLSAGSHSSQGHPERNSANGRARVSAGSNRHLDEQNSVESMMRSIEFLLRQHHQ